MNPNNREKEIFEKALDLTLPEARRGYVKGACDGNADLLARVETLLRAHDATGGFLPDQSGAAAGPTISMAHVDMSEKPGTMIGRYKLLQQIGEGGCGVVYMAEQEVPVRRRVALKVIKLGMDTKEVIARFEAERQALAMMDHPNIAKVLDAGATASGRPYFVMELVRGLSITKYCDEAKLSARARLELFIPVCHAIQHAHQKGIIHRDIKPSNVLVTINDGVAVSKVIDFGIAKATQGRLTDHTLFTAFEQFIGTPTYMSPEQAAMTSLDIDTRSDIYSLGVLLYELLVGRPPFDPQSLVKAGLDEIRRQIREVEPPRMSTRVSTLPNADQATTANLRQIEAPKLVNLLRGDLDWIVMRCLEKDRSRRYETATGLALDLQRHLHDEPVTARPPSTAYRMQKLVVRNKLAVAAAAVVTVALIGGLVASTLAYYNEKAAHQFAVETSHSLQKAMADARTAQLNSGEVLRQEAEKSIYAIQVMRAIVSHAATAAIIPEDRARILQLVDETVERLRHEPHIRPATKQQLLDTAGDIYVAFDELVRAENAYRQVLSIRQIIMGAGHPETATARQKLFEVLQRQGKSSDATGMPNPAQSSSAKRSPRNSDSVPLRLAAELRLKGLYAEADAQLREAIELRKQFATAHDDGYIHWQMARLHLDAGELRGPKKLALYELEADRGRFGWFRYGFWAGINFNSAIGAFNAHTMLGLIALREGSRTEAVQQLLQSANGIVDNPIMMREFKFGAPEVRLAVELLTLKETTAVLEFLERVRGPYVDALSARSRTFFFSASWEDYYTNSAKSRLHAEELAGWRQEILAGNIPATWQKLLEADRPLADVPPVHLESMEPLLADLPALHSILPSCALLCFGWLAVGLGSLRRAPEHLPFVAIKSLIALPAVRILTCVLFAGTFLVDGFRPDGLIIFVLTIAGWRLFWDFIQALAPTMVTRRETMFIRVLSWTSVLIPVTILAVTYLSKDRWSMVAFAGGLLMTALLTLVLVLSVCAVFVWRLWKWKPEGGLRRAKLVLLLSTPLVVLYAFACLSMPLFHESNPNGAVFLLWADALFPWLLAAGLFWRKTESAAPPLRPA